MLKKPLHFYQDWSQAPEVLHILNKLVSEADAYIIVTAEYNRSLPPGLTNLLNHLPPPRYLSLERLIMCSKLTATLI